VEENKTEDITLRFMGDKDLPIQGREKMKFYTIGYGNRNPQEFVDLLKKKGVKVVVDVRLRPDRAYTGSYKKAKSQEKGIQKLLATGDIAYISLVDLGNVFMGYDDWRERYQQHLEKGGNHLTEPLQSIPGPFCLMCAEKSPVKCHRSLIAEYLARKGYEVEHI
jgi:uncharacterized protein (DUF488 family)